MVFEDYPNHLDVFIRMVRIIFEYSGTSISGGAGTANTLIHPHSPVIHVQKRQNIIEYFLTFNRTN